MKAADEQYMDAELAASELNINVDALMEIGSRNLLVIRDGCEISQSSFLLLKALLDSIRRCWVDREIAADFIGSPQELEELVKSDIVETCLYMGMVFYKEADLARHTILLPPPETPAQKEQRQSTALGLTTAPRKSRRRAKPSLTSTAVSRQSSDPERQNEELVTVKEAADLLKVDLGTMWNWINQRKIESVTSAKRKTRSHLVKMSGLRPWINGPFANQKRFSFTEVGEMPDICVCRQTIRNWQRKGLIEVYLGPGGQPYMLEDQLPKCRKLAQRALVRNVPSGRPSSFSAP